MEDLISDFDDNVDNYKMTKIFKFKRNEEPSEVSIVGWFTMFV
jgi:hypothetical protein